MTRFALNVTKWNGTEQRFKQKRKWGICGIKTAL